MAMPPIDRARKMLHYAPTEATMIPSSYRRLRNAASAIFCPSFIHASKDDLIVTATLATDAT